MRTVVLKWARYSVLEKIEKVLFVVRKMTENATVFPNPNPPLADMADKAGEVADAESATSDGGKDRTQTRDLLLQEMIDMMDLQVLYVQTVTLGDPDLTALAGMDTKSDGTRWPLPDAPGGFIAKPGKFEGSVYMKCDGTKYKKEYVFQIWEGDSDSGAWKDIKTQGSNIYLHTGLERGKLYTFRVYAINSKGRGPASNVATSAAS